MKYIFKLCILIPVMTLISGCAFLSTYHNKDVNFSQGNTAVDAKQRFLIYGSAPDSTIVKRYEDGQLTEVSGERLIYCAEPSPDALSAFSAAFDMTLVKPEVAEAVLKGAFSESSATIGIRTQSIQLLRDAMYRSCEAYMAGALNKDEFADLQKSYQKSMVTLMAIEQLARAVAPGQVVINSSAARTASKNIVELQKMLEKSTASVVELTEKKAESDDKLASATNALKDKVTRRDGSVPNDFDDAKAICEGKEGVNNVHCKEYSSLVSANALAESSLKRAIIVKNKLEDSFDKANNDPNLKADTTASISYNLKGAQQSPKVSKHVAETVQSLVSMVYLDNFVQTCTSKVKANEKKVKLLENINIEIDKINANTFYKILNSVVGPAQLKSFEPHNGNISKEKADEIRDEAIKEVKNITHQLEESCNKVFSAYATALTPPVSDEQK